MVQLTRFVNWLNSLGISANETARVKASKNLVVYLALFMSFGGIVWGSLLLYYNLSVAALVPYGYVVISVFNISIFSRTRNFYWAAAIQIIVSMLLPFMLQWQLGGFFASGCVMLWSALSLIGAIILLQGYKIYPYLTLYFGLVLFSFWFDSYFASHAPSILTPDVSLLMLFINVIMIASAGFALLKSKIDKDFVTQNTLEELQKQYQANLASEREIRSKLQVSENREARIRKELEMIVSSIDDIVVEFDEGGRFKNFWCRDESKLSRPVSYYIGKTLTEAFSYAPEFANRAQQVYEKVCLTGKPFIIEIDNNVLPTSRSYEFRLNPIPEIDGSVKRCSVLVTDITVRKLAETKQKEDYSLMRTIIDNLPLNVYVKNLQSQKILANRADWQYLGATAESDLIGKSAYDLYPDNSAQQSIEEDKLIFQGQSILGKETISTTKDGRQTHFITSKVPLRNSKNNIIGLVGISVDNTEQKRRELEMKKLSAIVEDTTNLTIVTDIGGNVTWANKSFEAITGYSKAEVMGKNPGKLLQGPETNDDTVRYMREHIQKRSPFECEILNYTKDKQSYWIRITCQPIIDEFGNFRGYFSVQQHITKEVELRLQLVKAKEEAEESNRLKTIFLGNLSHEVRTPMQGILGFAEILENPKLSELKRKEYINIIKRRTADMQNIIESLLDMASLETGEIKAFPVNVNLHDTIEQVFFKVKQDHDLTEKSIQLVLKNNLKLTSEAKIDPQHLHQVVTNLISNAIKFTSSGLVILSCEERSSSFAIHVVDSGMGISPDKIEHIFEPFRQAHEGISRSKGGIGLGLSICKKMVEMWGGTIHVVSKLDAGSTFSFTIPSVRINQLA